MPTKAQRVGIARAHEYIAEQVRLRAQALDDSIISIDRADADTRGQYQRVREKRLAASDALKLACRELSACAAEILAIDGGDEF